MADNPHVGHRKRLKNQYLVSGAEGMSDFTFLELLLFFAIPQGDTNDLAHDLLERFGSFDKLLEASYEELLDVNGIGEHAAIYITLFKEVMTRYNENKSVKSFKTSDTELIENFLHYKYMGVRNERAMLIHFDSSQSYINHTWIGDGNFENVRLDNRMIARAVIENHAKYVIAVHNHPSGVATPSGSDMIAVRNLVNFLNTIDTTLIDNIIVTDDSAFFFSQSHKGIDCLFNYYPEEEEKT